MRALFRVQLGWRWLLMAIFLLAGIALMTFGGASVPLWIGLMLVVSSASGIVMWVKTYIFLMSANRTKYDAMGDPTITVTLCNEYISVSSDASSQKIQWNNVTRRVATNEHLLLFSKKVIMGIIPLQKLSPDAKAAIDQYYAS